MKFNDLIKSMVKRRLENIYRERNNLNNAKCPFDKTSIRSRGSVLIKQFMLEKLVQSYKILGFIK